MNRKVLLVAQAIVAIVVGSAIGVAAERMISTSQAKLALAASPLVAVDTGFTYQGYLSSGGVPANGLYDFTFKLFNPNGSLQLGSTITLTNQTVNNGLFTVSLDFGDMAFVGQRRLVKMGVRPAGVGSFDTLGGQALSPVPYALSSTWTGVGDKPWNYTPFHAANVSTVITDQVGANTFSAVATGADGLPLIAHSGGNLGAGTLSATHCVTLDCGDFDTSTIFTHTVNYVAATLGRDGLVLIAAYDVISNALLTAHCSDVECNAATVTLLDTSADIGSYASITIGADGLGLISYLNSNNGDLKVAHCSNVNCTSATISTLDSTGDVGYYTGITTGYDGLGLISYYDNTAHDLKVAHCDNTNCTTAILTTLDSTGTVGVTTSIATGADGLGVIAYRDQSSTSLKVAHCDDAVCTSATITTVDNTNDVGAESSIIAGVDGLPVITYRDQTNNDLRFALCQDAACTGAVTSAVSSNTSRFSSINWGIDGLPVISYWDSFNIRLVVIHCGSPTCISNYHAR